MWDRTFLTLTPTPAFPPFPPLSFCDDAVASRVKTCLTRSLRKQVHPKTNWRGSASEAPCTPRLSACPIPSSSVTLLAYVFPGRPPSPSSIRRSISLDLDLEEPHGPFERDVLAINEHVGYHGPVAPP